METSAIPINAPSEWQPITKPLDLAVLGKTGEELTECATALFRCIIQGMNEAEPTTKKINRAWLQDEVADVMALLTHLIAHFNLNQEAIQERLDKKYAYKKIWFDALRSQA